MAKSRNIQAVLETIPTIEGAGVALRRAFSNREAKLLDPFLLLDDFGSEDPEDWIKGFPWHPHRGIETITYVLDGNVRHEDSLGNAGEIVTGDVQWMTAGSGIIHQEMPQLGEGSLWGLQLWANLPSDQKMMTPRYRDVKGSNIPVVRTDQGLVVRIISGSYNGVQGPVGDVVIEPQYLDVTVPTHQSFAYQVPTEHTVFSYIIDGSANFGQEEKNIGEQHLVVYKPGDRIDVRTEEEGTRFLLVTGKPLRQPIAWYGPIVMNTQEEIQQAVEEFQSGNFIKYKPEH